MLNHKRRSLRCLFCSFFLASWAGNLAAHVCLKRVLGSIDERYSLNTQFYTRIFDPEDLESEACLEWLSFGLSGELCSCAVSHVSNLRDMKLYFTQNAYLAIRQAVRASFKSDRLASGLLGSAFNSAVNSGSRANDFPSWGLSFHVCEKRSENQVKSVVFKLCLKWPSFPHGAFRGKGDQGHGF